MTIRASFFENLAAVDPLEQELTLEALDSLLTKPRARSRQDGRLWSPAIFRTGSTRSGASVEEISAFVLDFDDGDDPKDLEQYWAGWRFVVHSTYHHMILKGDSPACPRWRAVFPLAGPVPADGWKSTYEKLALHLGRGLADPVCKDLARMYFLPSCPPEMLVRAFAWVHEGELLEPAAFTPFEPEPREPVGCHSGSGRPGDLFNARAKWLEILAPYGWTLKRADSQRELWTRPGKDPKDGHSAIAGTSGSGTPYLYLFSSNAPPFEPNKGYSPFGAYALLNHAGDWSAAARSISGEAPAIESGILTANGMSGSDLQELRSLAAMDPISRGRSIKASAARLKISVTDVRAALKTVLPSLKEEGKQGSEVEVPDREPWPEPVVLSKLLDELTTALKHFLVLPRYGSETLALWVVHTYSYWLWDWTPKLGLLSPEPECGKSSLLFCLENLVAKAVASSSVTVAALFRLVDNLKPTVLMDEFDGYSKDNEDLRCLLNASSEAGKKVVRCVGDDFQPRSFEVFTPVAYAMIGKPWDTVASRSIILVLQRKRKTDQVAKLRKRAARDVFGPLARKATRWAADHQESLSGREPSIPDALGDRASDIWEPLLAIAEAAGDHWPETGRLAALQLSSKRDVEDQSCGIRLLQDIRLAFGESSLDRMPSQHLCDRLASSEDGLWKEFGKSGKPITPTQLAGQLARYKIKSRSIRVGTETPKGYMREWFEDAFERYLEPSPPATAQQSNGEGKCGAS